MINIYKKRRRWIHREQRLPDTAAAAVDEKKYDSVSEACTEEIFKDAINDFSDHVCKYIGNTVTIFVSAGGICGLGFTGILLSSNKAYIRILTRIGSPPACSLSDGFSKCCIPYFTSLQHMSRSSINLRTVMFHPGSIACIPVNKVASFVHNTL